MRSNRRLIRFVTAFAVVFGLLTSAAPLFAASEEKVLYSFSGGSDGALPIACLIFDAAGNLYGTTVKGGNPGDCGGYGCGTVFKLAPGTDGKWTETVVYGFTGGSDGNGPSAGLIFDATGNLYGTTSYGGGSGCGGSGCGTVFELIPGSNGTWTESVLHSFNGKDGYQPWAVLIFDAVGNLYGTTWEGGAHGSGCNGNGCGTVFQLAPRANGKWKEKVLHSFNGQDGSGPSAGVIFDATGNLYGTTYAGGSYGWGTVFQLRPGANGRWAEGVLHSFGKGNDGSSTEAGVIFDAAGNLYGTAGYGGAHVGGIIFQLTLGTNGKWGEKVLHSFYVNGRNGSFPQAGLIFDGAGNLYGTTTYGGAYGSGCNGQGCGTVFRLELGTNGKWGEKVLHSFGEGDDGDLPDAGLIFDAVGNLYSTTHAGGAYGGGTVFEITP